MTDTEKKIAEIRKSAEEAQKTDRSWVDGQDYADDVEFLLDELDRLRAERDSHGPEGRNYTNKQYVDLLAERDKLIEGLRWYGDRETYDGFVEWDDDGNIIRAEWPPINVDNGQRARDILKEIGVTVE